MTTIALSSIALIIGIWFLMKGADWLVEGSTALALRLGVTPLVIGLTVVALGTSMPELATSLQGGSTIAIGNSAGSNLMNLGLVLGLTALIAPIHCKANFLKFELPVMVIAGPAMLAVTWDDTVTRVEGIILVACLIAYLVISGWRGRQEELPEVVAEAEEFVSKAPSGLGKAIFLVLIGLVGLVIGGRSLVFGARELALLIGMSERIVALTVVAGGTSLPELATCLVAARKNEPDIALGNVVGSNIFNIFGIIGVVSMVSPIDVPAGANTFDIPAVILIQFLCIPIMVLGFKVSRLEGLVLLASYAAYLLLLFVKM